MRWYASPRPGYQSVESIARRVCLMPRIARVVVPGLAHHVTQRGNRRENVFFSDEDRQRYLQLLIEYADKAGLQILAYCLMANHVHLVCIPADVKSLAVVFKPVHTRYAQYVNRKLGICGRLWQGRFFSCPLDESHLWAAIRYVERNPVRASMVRKAEDYPWSSAAAHCGVRSDPVLFPLPEPRPAPGAGWSAWLIGEDDGVMLEQLRRQTRNGRPLGDQRFIAELEARLGRRVHALPKGRPSMGGEPLSAVHAVDIEVAGMSPVPRSRGC
jgi:putative transposase